jgi:hypothetical protein
VTDSSALRTPGNGASHYHAARDLAGPLVHGHASPDERVMSTRKMLLTCVNAICLMKIKIFYSGPPIAWVTLRNEASAAAHANGLAALMSSSCSCCAKHALALRMGVNGRAWQRSQDVGEHGLDISALRQQPRCQHKPRSGNPGSSAITCLVITATLPASSLGILYLVRCRLLCPVCTPLWQRPCWHLIVDFLASRPLAPRIPILCGQWPWPENAFTYGGSG